MFGLVVYRPGIIFINIIVAGAGAVLKLKNRVRIEQVEFAMTPPVILTAVGQHIHFRGPVFRICMLVPQQGFPGNGFQSDTTNSGSGPGEILVDNFPVQANGFKNLSRLVALDGADSHFGYDFQDGFIYRFDVIGDSFLRRQVSCGIQLFWNLAGGDHFIEGFKGQVWINCPGAIADQESKMHDFAGLSGFHDNSSTAAQAGTDQVVMQTGGSQQGGDWCMVRINVAVGQDNNVHAVPAGGFGFGEQVFQRRLKPSFSCGRIEGHGQGDGIKIADVHGTDFFELFVGENYVFYANEVGVLRSFVKDVMELTQVVPGAHDHFFADGIDGRIGDLGKKLLEIVIEQLGFVGQDSQGGISSHGPEGFFSQGAHGG